MKTIFLSLFLFACTGCMNRDSDSLDNITEEVLKKNRGVDIEITPEK